MTIKLKLILVTFCSFILFSCKKDESKPEHTGSNCITPLESNEYFVDLTARTWKATSNPTKYWLSFSYDDQELAQKFYDTYYRVFYCDSKYTAAIVVVRDNAKPVLNPPVYTRDIEITERDYHILTSGIPVYFENKENLK